MAVFPGHDYPEKGALQLCWSRNLGSKFTPELQLKGQVTQRYQWDPGHPPLELTAAGTAAQRGIRINGEL